MAGVDRSQAGGGDEAAARQTAGITTGLVVRHVRAQRGEEGVAELLRLSGSRRSAAELEDEGTWSSYAEKIALFEAAATVLDDPLAGRHIGETVLVHRVALPLKLLLRAMGTPQQVLRSIARTGPRFSTVCTMAAPEVQRGGALITYRLHDGNTPHRMDCDYNIGLLSQVPVLFGMRPAAVEHEVCQVRGAAHCEYRLRWAHRSRLSLRRRASRRAMLEDQLITVTERTRALQSTIADLVSDEDVDTVLARITVRAGETVRAPRYLLAVRPSQDSPLRVHHHGFGAGLPERLVDELLADTPDERDGARLVVDVASARRHYGRLAALWEQEGAFFPEERQLLATYARQAAAALDAATALAEARERQQTASVLLDLARSLARVGTPRAMAGRLVEAVPDVVVGVKRAVVAVWDEDDLALIMSAAQGFSAAHTQALLRLRLHPEDTPELASMLREPAARYYDRDSTSDPMVGGLMETFGSTAIVVVPIVARNEFLGLICADTGEGGLPLALTPVMWQRLTGLADQAAVALENARLVERQRVAVERLRASEEKARHQANHDALTGLPNRLRFKERLRDALDAAADSDLVGVMLLDLDNFKHVNDTMGHAAADRLLQEVAGRIAHCVRAEDTAARLGGDEFALVLPHMADVQGCVVVAEKIQQALRDPLALDGTQMRVTASIGIAVYPRDGGDGETLLGNADTAMYRAKRAGRDAWRLHQETGSSAWEVVSSH